MANVADLGQSGLVLLVLVFSSVVLLVVALSTLLRGRIAAAAATPNLPAVTSVRYAQPKGRFAAMLARIGNHAAESEKATERNHVRQQLVRAGFRNPVATYIYFAARVSLAVAVPLVAGGFSYMVIGNLSAPRFMLLIFGAAAGGLFLPSYWLSNRVKRRRAALQNSFPDALDLLLVCVEAGASFAAGLQRVAQELRRSHAMLAEELQLVSAGLSAGQTKEDALRQFADRTATDDIAAFATIMIQSEMFGTSISDTLRVQASDMRQQRMLRAEEMANKLPVKITFPLAVMIFPVMLIVILAPLLMRISEALGI